MNTKDAMISKAKEAVKALTKNGGDRTGTAMALGITGATLQYRLKVARNAGIEVPPPGSRSVFVAGGLSSSAMRAATKAAKEDQLKQTLKILADCGGDRGAAAVKLKTSRGGLNFRLHQARTMGFEVTPPPSRAVDKAVADGRAPAIGALDDKKRLEMEKQAKHALEKELVEAHRRIELAYAAKTIGFDHTITIKPHPKGKKRQAAAVMLASDWHIEEPVDADKVNGRNSYNIEIAEARAKEFFRGVAWKIRHHLVDYDIKTLVAFLMGDFITGYIHPELMETSAMSPAKSIAWWVELAAAGLEMILDEFPFLSIDAPCIVGNHGRTTEKTRVSTRVENSFEWLGFHMLAERMKKHEKRLRFHIAAGAHVYVDVLGWTIRGTHGDDIRYQGGVGGLTIPLRKAVDAWNEARKADYTVLGHWHTFFDAGFAVVNGSLIGYSPYSQWVKARYEPPAQAFFLIDKERGKDYVSPIWVDKQGTRR